MPVIPTVSMNFQSGSNTGKQIRHLSHTLKHCENQEAFQNAQFVRVNFLMPNILCMQRSHVSDILDQRIYPALVFFNFKSVNFVLIDGLNFSHSAICSGGSDLFIYKLRNEMGLEKYQKLDAINSADDSTQSYIPICRLEIIATCVQPLSLVSRNVWADGLCC